MRFQESYQSHAPLEKVTQLSHTSKLVFDIDKSSHRQEYPQFPPMPAVKTTGLFAVCCGEQLRHKPKPRSNLVTGLLRVKSL